jgi:hypothetical protein
MAPENLTHSEGDISLLVRTLAFHGGPTVSDYLGVIQFGTEAFLFDDHNNVTFDAENVAMKAVKGVAPIESAPATDRKRHPLALDSRRRLYLCFVAKLNLTDGFPFTGNYSFLLHVLRIFFLKSRRYVLDLNNWMSRVPFLIALVLMNVLYSLIARTSFCRPA